ncbi:MAG: DUF3467 domain-containing protein [Prevotellaceae bacterium]|jgi:hypothetical protein|nr:DUF3467 domain-containing protein [Prevotellaceae bacterium]
MEPNKNNEISIELSEEMAQGTYANLAVISHSSSEFVLDFVRLMPGITKAKVQSRIILMPEHAKRLLAALQDNVSKYESVHGKIKANNGVGMPPIPMTFGNNTAQA